MRYILASRRFLPVIMSQSLHTSAAPHRTITEAITHDHNELKEYYQHYCQSTTDTQRQKWFNQFQWELARHSIGEELLLYPAFEKNLPNGKQMADEDRAEHQEAKNLLYKLEKTPVTDPEHSETFKVLFTALTEHMKTEEENDLPMFEKTMEPDESAAMAQSFMRTKKFVPTRSHPSAPDKPPFETAAGLLAAPIDKLKDMFASFPDESDKTETRI